MRKFLLVITLLISSITFVNAQSVNHIVKKGETLYRLSVQYKVSVGDIKKSNPKLVGDGLGLGDVIKIPVKKAKAAAKKQAVVKMDKPAVNPKTKDLKKKKKKTDLVTVKNVVKKDKPAPAKVAVKSGGKTHTVKAGETLYGVARATKTAVADIKKWNNMTDNALKIGQVLVVSKGGTATVAKPEKPAEKSDLQVVKNEVSEAAEKPAEMAVMSDTPAPIKPPKAKRDTTARMSVKPLGAVLPGDPPVVTAKSDVPERASIRPRAPMTSFHRQYIKKSKSSRYKSVKQNGIATWFDDGGQGSNMYALHKTAPFRSIVKVTNPMNQQSIHVMVIERLPATITNDNVLIKLTSSAAKKLNILDQKSIVETAYLKRK